MKFLNKIEVGYKLAAIVQFARNEMDSLPIDERIFKVREQVKNLAIVLLGETVDDFLTEVIDTEAAEIRSKIIQSHKGLVPLENVLADNIEDVTLLTVEPMGKVTIGEFTYDNICLVILPNELSIVIEHENLVSRNNIANRVKSRSWKSSFIDLSELHNKFEKECEIWEYYEREPQEMTPDKIAIAKMLGMDVEGLDHRNNYWKFARNKGILIGKAVGKTNKVNWLGTDLKLEHFIQDTEDHVFWVDHSDDVMLLREIEIDEAACCIAPLYQQMDYLLWSGFRIGYFIEMGMKGGDILNLIEGKLTYNILGNFLMEEVRNLRKENKIEDALNTCGLVINLFQKYENELKNNCLYFKAILVKADIYMSNSQNENAIDEYKSAIDGLNSLNPSLRNEGLISKCGALINLSICLYNLGKKTTAATVLGNSLSVSDEIETFDKDYGEYLKKVISQNMKLYSE